MSECRIHGFYVSTSDGSCPKCRADYINRRMIEMSGKLPIGTCPTHGPYYAHYRGTSEGCPRCAAIDAGARGAGGIGAAETDGSGFGALARWTGVVVIVVAVVNLFVQHFRSVDLRVVLPRGVRAELRSVDGRDYGWEAWRAGAYGERVKLGTYTLTVTGRGIASWESTVVVSPFRSVRLVPGLRTLKPERAGHHSRPDSHVRDGAASAARHASSVFYGWAGQCIEVRLWNVDDREAVLVNGFTALTAGYQEDTGWRDITPVCRPGENRIDLVAWNASSGYSCGFAVRVNGRQVYGVENGVAGAPDTGVTDHRRGEVFRHTLLLARTE
jgi:hypothetical protein